jgi:hypothetical protein
MLGTAFGPPAPAPAAFLSDLPAANRPTTVWPAGLPTNTTMKSARPKPARPRVSPVRRRLLRSPVLRVAAAALALASPVLAQTGPQLLLKPFPQELRLDMNAEASVTDQGRAIGQGSPLQIGIAEVEGRLRVSPGELASPRVGFGFKYFNLDSDLPGLPEHLYDTNVGFATPIGKYEDWIFAASAGVGYAGEGPFGDANAFYGQASLMAFRQIDENSGLAFVLDYNGNRTFKPDVPLPGFAYFKKIDKTLSLTVGLPVTSVEWKPTENLRVDLSYLLVDNFQARVGYQVGGGVEVFGAVSQRSDAFFLDGAENSRDRLLFQQRRAELGVTYRSKGSEIGGRDFEFTLAGGYAFNGELSEGSTSSTATWWPT